MHVNKVLPCHLHEDGVGAASCRGVLAPALTAHGLVLHVTSKGALAPRFVHGAQGCRRLGSQAHPGMGSSVVPLKLEEPKK